MIEVKNFSGGLNKDSSKDSLPPNDYVDALNITHDAVEGGNDDDITNIVANRIGDATYVYPVGINKSIGAYPNTLRNTIIHFLWNSQDYHSIIEFNLTTRLHTKIFENLTDSDNVDILGFTQSGKIINVNIYNREEGDLLFFLDSLGRPTQMDITLFKSGEYTPVTRAIINKAKKPPLSPPSVVFDNDTERRSNNFRNKLMRTKYRWIFDDFEKSTFSPISIVPLPVSILSDIYTSVITNNNVIRMSANTGDKNVKAIEIAMSFVEKTNNWSDFQSVAVIEKTSLVLSQSTEIQAGTLGVNIAISTFSGTPTEGTIIDVYFKTVPGGVDELVGTYTVSAGDTTEDVATGIVASMLSLGIAITPFAYNSSIVYPYSNVSYQFDRIDIDSTNTDLDNVDFAYSFYNDSTYPNIDIEESIQLFDYVPPKANAQELLNGNILAYAGITEGYNKDTVKDSIITVDTVAAGDAGGGTLFYAVMTLLDVPAGQQNIFTLTGIPATGTIVEIKVKRKSDHAVITATTYTTVAGDTIGSVIANLVANESTPNMTVGSTLTFGELSVYTEKAYYEAIATTYFSQMVITAPSSATATNSIATWKWSTERTIARAYYDEHGVTNGVLYTDKVTFPAYDENGSEQPLVPYINYKINDIPPIWAKSVQFLINRVELKFIFWQSFSVNTAETEYIYFEVSSFVTNATKKPSTATVLSYTFKEGDRVRLLRDTNDLVLDDTYDAAIEGLVVDPIINFIPQTDKQFIKIKNVAPFTGNVTSGKNYVMELYTPLQQAANKDNQVFVEFGQEYEILDAGLSSRRHAGMVTDQVVGTTPAEYNFYEGDVYFRSRTIAVGDVGYATFNVVDTNFVDLYPSAVSSVDGRANIIDTNARNAYYSTMIRFGQAYEANTNINGLNRFYAKNFDEYDYSFGDVLALVVKNRQLIVLQKYKIGNVPLYSALGKDANGLQVVFQTDKLLNPIQYYVGDFGIGTCPESIASFNYAVYGCDNIKGVIWRLSNDGVKPISILYKMNSWANENLNQLNSNYKVYGAFDQRLNNYIITLSLDDTVCVGVVVPEIILPNGVAGEYYRYTVRITGTPEFTLLNVVKPEWMTISVVDKIITFAGKPDEEAFDIPVSFDIENACGFQAIPTITFNIIEMITGTIQLWSGLITAIPATYYLCDGAEKNRIGDADLFAVIGTTYGVGNGTTTFNLPSIRKRVVAGYDDGDAEYGTIGAEGGSGITTLTDQQMAHKHTYLKYDETGSGTPGDNGPNDFSYVPTDTSSIGNPAIARDPIDTRDEYIVFPYIIKR